MKILFKAPGEPAEVREIENRLEVLQRLVGGYIEVVHAGGPLRFIVNEEGKLLDLKPNLFSPMLDVLVGSVIATAYDGEGDFRSLTAEEIKLCQEYFTDCEVY